MTRPALLLAALLCGTPAVADDFARPDPTMTPGAVDTSEVVFCSHKSKERRSRKASAICTLVFDAYNIPRDPFKRAGYQCDHLVPLAIGGATTTANLWPQPNIEAAFKDACDRKLFDLVCHAKTVAANEAQQSMAADWPTACAKWLGR